MEQMIKSENALRMAGMKLRIEGLGAVKADRFDYTEWQRDLWKDKTIEEIHASATAFYEGRHG